MYFMTCLGPELPIKVKRPSMISLKDEVILIGGMVENDSSTMLYKLFGDIINTLKWKPMDHTLKYSRYSHPIAFPIPKELTNCTIQG